MWQQKNGIVGIHNGRTVLVVTVRRAKRKIVVLKKV